MIHPRLLITVLRDQDWEAFRCKANVLMQMHCNIASSSDAFNDSLVFVYEYDEDEFDFRRILHNVQPLALLRWNVAGQRRLLIGRFFLKESHTHMTSEQIRTRGELERTVANRRFGADRRTHDVVHSVSCARTAVSQTKGTN